MSDGSMLPDSLELSRLRQAVEASGEVIFMTDVDGVFTFVNPQFERTYGYVAAEVVGHATPRILKGGLLSQPYYQQMWQELRAGHTLRAEFVNQTKAGHVLTVEASVSPIRGAQDQRIAGFLAIQRDITDRKRAERALHDSETTLRLITAHVSDMVSQVRLDGTYLYASEAHERVLGYTPQSLLGTSAFALVHPDDVAHVQEEIAAALQQRAPHRFEFRYRHSDGHYIWLEAYGTLLLDDTQTPIGAVLSARDVTERRRLEEGFRHAQKMEAVGRLAGGIAHDFNNVLTAIMGYSELLLDQYRENAPLVADLQEILNAGQRASRLTRQLLTFSRKQIVNVDVVDLNAVVTEVESMVRRVIGDDVESAVSLAPGAGLIRADRGQLEQIVMNLAVNARDAMPKGGRLTIRIANEELTPAFVLGRAGATTGSYVSLAVGDTGNGMTSDVLSHVFEPFFTTKPLGRGTGLGLATVYGIVKDSGGFVTVESAVGVGTTVTAYFPRTAERIKPRAAVRPAVARRGTETILLAEDESVVRDIMVKTLRGCGYTVLAADGAAQAFSIEDTHEGPIHLLVSDIIMPGLNGADLAQRLVQRRPDLRVLYVSGFANHLTVRLGTASPHAAFLAKPFGPDRLAQSVRDLLDRPLGTIGSAPSAA